MKKISITLGITVALFSVANAQHHSVNAYQHQTNETFVVNNDGYANQEWNSESHSHQGHYKHHSENFHQEHYHYNSCADHSDYRPMSQFDFENAKQSIASRNFEDTRLSMAKQIVSSNGLLCFQVRQLMNLMSFESTRMQLAKFAWFHAMDKQNFYTLNDAFVFESSIQELNKYIEYN